MSCRKGDGEKVSSSKSNKDSIPPMENLPAEVISHRERRRRLFAKGSADWISHGDYMRSMSGKERETDDEEDEWESRKSETPMRMEVAEEGCALRTEEEEEEEEEQKKADLKMIRLDESSWMTVDAFRRQWNKLWSGSYGSFEDTTEIPPMQFTDKPAPTYSRYPIDTVQVFSVKLAASKGRLQPQFDVFGMVAIRDPVDHNRNIIFQRSRDDCQTLTIEDPYLVLTGPTRAVMFITSCPVVIEVDLKVKGATESEDECLGPLVMPVVCFTSLYSRLLNYEYTSKLSTLEFTLGHINSSVEATIFVSVIHGSWPDGLRGVFAAFTTGIYDGFAFLEKRVTGIGHERIVLLDSRGEKLPITGDGKINLSRRVVSVETSGKMIVRVKALDGDEQVEKETSFDPFQAGSSNGELEFSFCKMEVTVFWSLIAQYS
ncbi:unnamed protein product [Urochloa decumbens]|uniref:DUF6598 domain-containing protein n=1 Tax=Urochloa decumbens TaxID=240449 RepID=A0ABC9FZA1_9POAL